MNFRFMISDLKGANDMRLVDTVKMDKSKISVVRLGDDSVERKYWHSKTPYERLIAVEIMRQIAYGYNPSTTRLARVYKVTQLKSR
jgi:hypothetical protein